MSPLLWRKSEQDLMRCLVLDIPHLLQELDLPPIAQMLERQLMHQSYTLMVITLKVCALPHFDAVQAEVF